MPMAQIDPSIYDDLLTTGQQSAALDPQILMQQEMAKRLRLRGQVPEQAYMSGRRAVAPHAMEYISGLVNQGVAGQRDKDALGMHQQQQGIQADQVRRVLAALKAQREMQAQMNQPPQSAMPMGPNIEGGQ